MTLFPAGLEVTFRPGGGASFGTSLILGDLLNGVLGTNELGGNAAPAGDITTLCRSISIRRGRDDLFDAYNAGTAVIELLDDIGDFNPADAAGPFYEELLPGRQIRINATYQNQSIYLFSGYVNSYQWQWVPELERNIVTITAEDPLRFLAYNTVSTVAGATAGQTSGERINSLLDAAGWSSTLRNIANDGITVQADPGGARILLEACQTVEQSELGAFFADGAGRIVFRSRAEVGRAATAVSAPVFIASGIEAVVFSDVPGLIGGVQYREIEVGLDDTKIRNNVTVQRLGGSAQTVTDTDSVDDYFQRSERFTGLLMQTDARALAAANQILQYRKQPQLEIRSLAIEMLSDNLQRIEAGLGLELGDPIDVTRSAVGGPISARLLVQGIQHDITPGSWTTRFSTSRPLSFPFILGSGAYGVLDESTL